MEQDEPVPRSVEGRGARHSSIVVLTAILVSLVLAATTWPENTGDAIDYARDAAAAPTLRVPSLYEPGHLLWRPVGVVLREVDGRAPSADASMIRSEQLSLTRFSVVTGAVAAAATGLLVLQVVGALGAALLAVMLTVLGAAFLNFAQTGSSYVAGLACVCLALWLGVSPRAFPIGRAVAAGIVLAIGVLLWLPYVLVVPATLITMLLLAPGDIRRRVRDTVVATVACGIVGVGAYAAAASANGITSLHGFVAWVGRSSHGIARPGLARVVIGLPRSFVHMGLDGREVKRYLLHDPLNPVSRADLAQLHLWPKLLIFYGVTALVLWFALRRPVGRQLLLLLVTAVVPVVALGASWSGGEEERYLPLYPFLILLLAWAAWSARRERRRAVPVAVGAIAALCLTNLFAFSPWVARERVRTARARLGCSAMDERSVIVVPQQADPLVTFARDRLDELPRSAGTGVDYLLPSITMHGLTWDETLTALVSQTASAGGHVWVPDYALDSIPPRWSGWVEGAQQVPWSEVRRTFSALPLRRSCDPTSLLEVVPR